MSNPRTNIENEVREKKGRIWYRVDFLPEYIVHADELETNSKQPYPTKRFVQQMLLGYIKSSSNKNIQVIKLQHFTLIKEEELKTLLSSEYNTFLVNDNDTEKPLKPEIVLRKGSKKPHLILNHLPEELVETLTKDMNQHRSTIGEKNSVVEQLRESEAFKAFKAKKQNPNLEPLNTTSITAAEIPNLPREFFDNAVQPNTTISTQESEKEVLNSGNPNAAADLLVYLRNEFQQFESMPINTSTLSQTIDISPNSIDEVSSRALNPGVEKVQQPLIRLSIFSKLQNSLDECINKHKKKVFDRLQEVESRLNATETMLQNSLKRNAEDSGSERPSKKRS